MSVYVDGAENAYGRMKMCHMIADSLDELLSMADTIGVARKWFQACPPASFPHFDIAQSKKRLALEAGAVEVSRRVLVSHMKRLRLEWFADRHAAAVDRFGFDSQASEAGESK